MSVLKKIVVGSANPVKIRAAVAGFAALFPDSKIEGEGIAAPSGVGDQPMSCAETLRGATNRMNYLRDHTSADFFVGIEGGIEVIEETLFANAWIVISDAQGRVARGRSGSFALPPEVKQLIEDGIELGHANDQVFGELNSKQAGGAVGSLTGGTITRQSLYEHAMALTLAAYRNETMYFDVGTSSV